MKRWYLQEFLILIFWVVSRVKGQKMAQNDKIFCLSHSVYHEPYIIWLWFFVHMCKMTISPTKFKFLIFCVFRGVKSQKMTNLSLSCFISQELYIISSGFLVCRCKIMIFLAVFFTRYNIVNIKIPSVARRVLWNRVWRSFCPSIFPLVLLSFRPSVCPCVFLELYH